MSIETRTFVIITLADYTNEELEDLITKCIQTSIDTLRKSVDETKAILKWDGNAPVGFEGLTSYSHSEIKAILETEEWVDDNE